MLHIWATVTTIANTALGVAGLGVAGYAVSAKPPMILFYYGVAFICVFGCIVGFVNMWFLNQAVRQYEEKNRPIREERERKKAERAAKRRKKKPPGPPRPRRRPHEKPPPRPLRKRNRKNP